MLRADIERVAEIEHSSYDTPWAAQDFARQLSSAGNRYWVASTPTGIVGYAGLKLDVVRGHVTTVTVDPAHREQRVGTHLMLTLTDQGRRAGLTTLRLEVRISNQQARALYRRFGFSTIGVRRSYYGNEDALIMEASSIDSPAYTVHLLSITT